MYLVRPLPVPQMSNSFFPFNPSLEDEMKRLFINFPAKDFAPVESTEDVMEEFRHNGQDFEYCPELESGTAVPLPTSRKKKSKKPMPTECVFCRNNGEHENYYRRHVLKDDEGNTVCPILRSYICPICGAFGDNAHTRKYCPVNPKVLKNTLTSSITKFVRNSVGRRVPGKMRWEK